MNLQVYKYYLLSLFYLLHVSLGEKFSVEFEGDKDGKHGRVMWRSAASSKKSLLMFEGDSAIVDFCFSSKIRVQITNVRYSNDGASDDFTIKVDDSILGIVRTNMTTNWGHAWNEFWNTGPVGEPMIIHSGNHKLTMTVTMSDNYGMELDCVDFDLENVPSDEVYFCQKAVTQEVVFEDIQPIQFNRDRIGSHSLEGNVKPFECLDKTNVEFCVVSTQFKGMTLEATSEWLNKTGHGSDWKEHFVEEALCNQSLYHIVWQVGQYDASNKEFGNFTGTDILLSFSIGNLLTDPTLFPGSLTTTFLQLNFQYNGANADFTDAFFSMGLINPENVIVTLNWMDTMIPKTSFQLTKDNSIATWGILTTELSSGNTNRILLTFQAVDKIVKIDFMRLYLEKPSQTPKTVMIERSKYFQIIGSINSGRKQETMVVSSEGRLMPKEFTEFSVMARKGSKVEYRKILTLVSDGRMFLYTIAEALSWNSQYPEQISRVSGLDVRPRGNGASIKRVDLDLRQQWINITFSDTSKASFKVSVVGDDTKLILHDFFLASTAERNRFVCYFSKFKNSDLAGINSLIVDDNNKYTVTREWMTLNGIKFKFDHENAFWYKQAGSDYVIRFPV